MKIFSVTVISVKKHVLNLYKEPNKCPFLNSCKIHWNLTCCPFVKSKYKNVSLIDPPEIWPNFDLKA